MVVMDKSGNLNIYRNLFLDVEELNRFFDFNENSVSNLLFTINAQNFGVINTAPNLSANQSFLLSSGSVPGTIRLTDTSYGLDSGGQFIFQEPFDNLPIQDTNGNAIQDQWAWVVIQHKEVKYEEGIVSIDVDGNLRGVNTEFTRVLRGQGSGFSTFVRLYTQGDDREITLSTLNSQLYEVTDLVDDTSVILSGDFQAESNLRYVVFGTFALGQDSSAIAAGGIYNYNGTRITFIPEVLTDFPPVDSITAGEQFFVARVFWNTTTNIVEVQDKRSFTAVNPLTSESTTFNNYYQLNFGDIIVNNKANIDASNIPTEFADEWRAALSLFSQDEINNALGNKANRGGDNLQNVATWRQNLEVPSNTEFANKANKDATGMNTAQINAWKALLEVQAAPSDTGWIACENPSGLSSFSIRARQIGKHIIIAGSVSFTGGSDTTVFRLPSAIPNPPYAMGYCAHTGTGGENNRAVNIRMLANANTCVAYDADEDLAIYINFSYFTSN